MRFSATAFQDLNHVAVWDSSPSVVWVLIAGRQALQLYPERGRVISACFNYLLTPDQLRYAVKTLRKARGGLEGWIVPALEWTQADLGAFKNPQHQHPELLAIIPELLEECRGLPVAEVWRRRRRELQKQWAEHLRDHPEEIGRITAPWMLPPGFPGAANR